MALIFFYSFSICYIYSNDYFICNSFLSYFSLICFSFWISVSSLISSSLNFTCFFTLAAVSVSYLLLSLSYSISYSFCCFSSSLKNLYFKSILCLSSTNNSRFLCSKSYSYFISMHSLLMRAVYILIAQCEFVKEIS